MSAKERSHYCSARRAGFEACKARDIARTLVAWNELKGQGLVRLRTERGLFDEWERRRGVTGDPELIELEREMVKRWGTRTVIAEFRQSRKREDWFVAGCANDCAHEKPKDWRQNPAVLDLMAAAVEAVREGDFSVSPGTF